MNGNEAIRKLEEIVEKERFNEAVELKNIVDADVRGRLKTKIYTTGKGDRYTANVFIMNDNDKTLMVTISIDDWNKIKEFVFLMGVPTEQEMDAMEKADSK